MGLIQTIKTALGFTPSIVPAEPAALTLTDAAERRVNAMRKDEALKISVVPSDDEHVITTTVVALDELPEGLGPIYLDDPEDRLNGLQLHWDGDRFKMLVDLRLKSSPTPNPNGRLFITTRFWVDGDPQFYRDGDGAPPLARRILAIPDVVSVLFRKHALTVQRGPDASWSLIDGAVETQLREYLLRGGQKLEPREREHADDEMLQQARAVLAEKIAPAVHQDGGDIELIDIVEGIARVRMQGACDGCPASTLTLQGGVQAVLTEAFPGHIVGVEAL